MSTIKYDKRRIPKSEKIKEKIKNTCKKSLHMHHINGNHFDDRPKNRILLTPQEHNLIHSIQGDLQHFEKGNKINLGRKHSEEFKIKRRKKYTGKGNPFYGKHFNHTEKTKEIISLRTKEGLRKKKEEENGRRVG